MRSLWLSITAAYVALLPSFYLVFSEENRRTLLWTRTYHAAIVSAVLLLGALYFAGYQLVRWVVRRSSVIRRPAVVFATWLLFVIALRTVVSVLDRAEVLPPAIQGWLDENSIKFLYYVGIPLPVIVWRAASSRRVMTNVYLVISPMVALLFFWPLTYRTYDVRNAPFWSVDMLDGARHRPVSGQSGIYVFILDEWSFDHTFRDGRLRDDLPHLQALSLVSTVYERAYSPGASTLTSIPRFLFQTDPDIQKMSYSNLQDWVRSPRAHDAKSIFRDAPKEWLKIVLGFWHDYESLVGAQVDYAAYVRNESVLRTYGSEVRRLLATQLGWLRHLGLPEPKDPLPPCALWIYSQEEIHRLALEIIEREERPVFAVFHYCFPHYPYIWDREGKRDWQPSQLEAHTESNYISNLFFTDRLMGEVVEALKAAGKYDGALLILTSDHGWRHDPRVPGYHPVIEDLNPTSRWRHVPLIIKRPYQREGRVVFDPIYTSDIYPEMHRVLWADDKVPEK